MGFYLLSVCRLLIQRLLFFFFFLILPSFLPYNYKLHFYNKSNVLTLGSFFLYLMYLFCMAKLIKRQSQYFETSFYQRAHSILRIVNIVCSFLIPFLRLLIFGTT